MESLTLIVPFSFYKRKKQIFFFFSLINTKEIKITQILTLEFRPIPAGGPNYALAVFSNSIMQLENLPQLTHLKDILFTDIDHHLSVTGS